MIRIRPKEHIKPPKRNSIRRGTRVLQRGENARAPNRSHHYGIPRKHPIIHDCHSKNIRHD